MTIPKVIHQFWGGRDFPEEYVAYRDSWLEHNPEWKLQVWSPDNLFNLRLREQYDRAEEWVMADNAWQHRSNIVRFEALERFGGVWADSDVECLRPLDPLLEGVDVFVGLSVKGGVQPAVLGCVPKHRFMRQLIEALAALPAHPIRMNSGSLVANRVMKTAGGDITRFGPDELDLRRDGFGSPNAYVVHHDRAY